MYEYPIITDRCSNAHTQPHRRTKKLAHNRPFWGKLYYKHHYYTDVIEDFAHS